MGDKKLKEIYKLQKEIRKITNAYHKVYGAITDPKTLAKAGAIIIHIHSPNAEVSLKMLEGHKTVIGGMKASLTEAEEVNPLTELLRK